MSFLFFTFSRFFHDNQVSSWELLCMQRVKRWTRFNRKCISSLHLQTFVEPNSLTVWWIIGQANSFIVYLFSFFSVDSSWNCTILIFNCLFVKMMMSQVEFIKWFNMKQDFWFFLLYLFSKLKQQVKVFFLTRLCITISTLEYVNLNDWWTAKKEK